MLHDVCCFIFSLILFTLCIANRKWSDMGFCQKGPLWQGFCLCKWWRARFFPQSVQAHTFAKCKKNKFLHNEMKTKACIQIANLDLICRVNMHSVTPSNCFKFMMLILNFCACLIMVWCSQFTSQYKFLNLVYDYSPWACFCL
jgi:hypothetical protein